MNATTSLVVLAALSVISSPAIGQPYFQRITTGDIVTDSDHSFGCAWGDYNNDGWIDVFVANAWGEKNALYRNNGDGTFTRVSSGQVANDGGDSCAGVWADYDNDGDLDLYVTNIDPPMDFFYRNEGDGTFTRVTEWVNAEEWGVGAAWGDYDQDGYVDLVVAAGFSLYRNQGNGEMARVIPHPFPGEETSNDGCAWGDFDGDGDLDLVVGKGPGFELGVLLFKNTGDLTFSDPIYFEGGTAVGLAWGDWDNNGLLDLFVANLGYGERNRLFKNDGSGGLDEVFEGPIANDVELSLGCAWGDYDNDGDLDLFVANGGFSDQPAQNDSLYRNNGDGTFTKVVDIEPVTDQAVSLGCGWGDYDNDGFLDLFVTTGGVSLNYPKAPNLLYRNEGNANAWLLVKLVGTVSNRSAIGAKVWVRASIGSEEVQQLREISGGSGESSQNDLRAHFGLGDAEIIDTLRIEWPSGIVQEFANIPARQILEVVEPPRVTIEVASQGPRNRTVFIAVHCWMPWLLEKSDDMVSWTPWTLGEGTGGTEDLVSGSHGFFRVEVSR